MSTPVLAVVIIGLIGMVIGAFLPAVILRVSTGAPVSRHPATAAADRMSARGRIVVAAATGIAFAAVGAVLLGPDDVARDVPRAATGAVLVAYLFLAAVSIVLAVIDIETRRLPNAIVLPSYGVLLGALTTACALGEEWSALARAVIGGAVLYAFYLALRIVQPGGMGGGDVKLAGVLGIALAWLGWGVFIVGAFTAFVLGGIASIVLLLTRRADRTSTIPFGPWMISGAWVGIFAGDSLTAGYVGLL